MNKNKLYQTNIKYGWSTIGKKRTCKIYHQTQRRVESFFFRVFIIPNSLYHKPIDPV